MTRRHWIEHVERHHQMVWAVSRRSLETDQWVELAWFDSLKLAEGWVLTIEQRQDDAEAAAYQRG